MKLFKKLGLCLTVMTLLLSNPTQKALSEEGEYAKEVKERGIKVIQCSKPIGTITAKSFKCKAAACYGERIHFRGSEIDITPKALGDGLVDMLLTALANTNCFRVVERAALEDIKEELELMGVKPKSTLKKADFIIVGVVTALELKASGVGGGGFIVPLPFGLGAKLGKSEAHIALDMRIVDVKSGEILAAKAVEGKSERWNIGVAGGGYFGGTAGGAFYEAVKNTPLEEATRDLIYHAVSVIIESVKSKAPKGVRIEEKELRFEGK